MRSIQRFGMLLGGLIIIGMPVLTGCSQQKMSQEMREQETEMTEESRRWADEVTQWTGMHQEMHAWHASHPASPADTAKTREHERKLASHEQDVANFSRDLEQHRARLTEESALPEKDRITAHAGLWTEHMKLKAAYELTARAHRELGEEHQEIVVSTGAAQPK